MDNQVIIDLSNEEAKKFFLKNEGYTNIDLPSYFCFEELLKKLSDELSGNSLRDAIGEDNLKNMKDTPNLNHIIYANKDGKLSWRPLQLIHPLAYLALVNHITKENNWIKLQKRFKFFQKNSNILCLSIPVVSNNHQSDKAAQVLKWWEGVEQSSISLSLEFDYIFDTDIADCYGSIYTHSLAWAVDGRRYARTRKYRDDIHKIGNIIDNCIQQMQYRQTNGIPQGSVLMDFIAEILLGYIDVLLSYHLKSKNIVKYKILRYRDDYRVFVKNKTEGERIIRILAEILQPFGLKLNASKTSGSSDIITNSIKTDKLSSLELTLSDQLNLQKKLLLLRKHSQQYPNSGSLIRGLTELRDCSNLNEYKNPIEPLISILADIAIHNPKTLPICCAFISDCLTVLESDDKIRLSKLVFTKLKEMPNSGFAQIWLQRIFKDNLKEFSFEEKLCRQVDEKKFASDLWDISWLDSTGKHMDHVQNVKDIMKDTGIMNDNGIICNIINMTNNAEVINNIKHIMNNTGIVSFDKLNSLPVKVPSSEINLFTEY